MFEISRIYTTRIFEHPALFFTYSSFNTLKNFNSALIKPIKCRVFLTGGNYAAEAIKRELKQYFLRAGILWMLKRVANTMLEDQFGEMGLPCILPEIFKNRKTGKKKSVTDLKVNLTCWFFVFYFKNFEFSEAVILECILVFWYAWVSTGRPLKVSPSALLLVFLGQDIISCFSVRFS